MYFENENERLAHPQASLIPLALWEYLFVYSISDEKINLMKIELPSIVEQQENEFLLSDWLCVLFGHLLANREELLEAARRLSLPNNVIFMGAMLANRLDIIDAMENEALIDMDAMANFIGDTYNFCLPLVKFIVAQGHFNCLDKLISLFPQLKQTIIIKAIQGATEYDQFDILNWCKRKASEQWQTFLSDNKEVILTGAGGKIAVLEWFKREASEQFQVILDANDYQAFRQAKLTSLDWFKTEATPLQLQAMIAAKDYERFYTAVQAGDLDVLYWLKTASPQQVSAMVAAKDYRGFLQAAYIGRIDVLDWHKREASEQLKAMIAVKNFRAFSAAAQGGHIGVLNWFKAEAPEELHAMITANVYGNEPGYNAYYVAAESGHLNVLQWLEAEIPLQLQAMLTANNFLALSSAYQSGRDDVVQHIISRSLSAFAYAEMHDFEYGVRYIRPFVTEKLAAIHAAQQQRVLDDPNVVFDLGVLEEAQRYFYILRHLIRRNDPTLLDEIRFLLDIPSVKALAHQAVTPNISNELLRLALTEGNEEAAAILLNIPAVRDLAAANGFYRNEQQGRLDLRALAEDNESSMRALTIGEKQRLRRMLEVYEPKVKAFGVSQVMNQLREQLQARYEDNPAKIMIDGQERTLPADWASFNALKLDKASREKALVAYYQNKNHTAIRYLSKPNPWMSLRAGYVNVNPANSAERWSTYEEYQPLIAMLWLAVTDATAIPNEGHTVESRLTHFIDELALIGRAHNWDDSREKVGIGGRVISEEYDDLKGDRPSCFSGVKRRLFQSVIGHPIFSLLTREIVLVELREFLRTQYREKITEDTRLQLKAYWDTYVIELELSDEGFKAFEALNVGAEEQQQFIDMLRNKYDIEYDAALHQVVLDAFALNAQSKNPIDYLHAFKHAGLVDLGQLLTQVPVKVNDYSFYLECLLAAGAIVASVVVGLLVVNPIGIGMSVGLAVSGVALATYSIFARREESHEVLPVDECAFNCT